MNNNRSNVWSPISPTAPPTAVDVYNSVADHHRLQPMTTTNNSPASNINPFQFGPLSTDYDSNNIELIQVQNSPFATANPMYHQNTHGGYNNNELINQSANCSSNSHNAVALNYTDQQRHQTFQQTPESLFHSPTFVTTPMGYPHGGDPSYLYSSHNFSSIFDTLHLSDGAILDSVARYTTTAGAIFQSSIAPYFNNPNAIMGPSPPKRRTGGRRPKEEEQKLPPEEEEKRRQKRLRNKEAAARCRKRRLDQMTTFEIKVDELQNNQNRLEAEFDRLMQEKNDLEFILQAHEKICQRRDLKPFAMVVSVSPVSFKTEPDETDHDEEKSSAGSDDPTLSSAVVNKLKRSMDNDYLTRPNTLQLGRALLPSVGSASTFENETPSRELFHHLLNQPTGLTPISNGGLTPFLFRTTSSSSNMLPSLDTPNVGESKIAPKDLTKL